MADTDLEPKPVNQDALVADIDRTRDQLAHTIDAISDRVSPKKSAQRAVDRIRKRLRAPGNRGASGVSNRAQARVLMIIGLPQSMIFEVPRACRAIMPAGAGLGRVLRPAG